MLGDKFSCAVDIIRYKQEGHTKTRFRPARQVQRVEMLKIS